MWWFLKKLIDDSEKVVYTYGFETREQSGKIKFDRETKEFEVLKIAENDSMTIVERFLLHHLFRIITEENAPNERNIAIC